MRRALVLTPLLAVLASWPSPRAATPAVFEGPVPKAACGAGSLPETGLQGQVPLADRQSGRSTKGYRCNLALVGQYQGQGTTWVSQSYKHCAYHSQAFPSSLAGPHPGVQIVDVRNPARPRLAGTLTSPAFLGNTWESLKVNEMRGLLAGVWVGPVLGVVFFDIYDIKTDCLHPRLLNSISGTDLGLPANTVGHEGNFSPDGRTYWSTGLAGGILTAIDVTNPAKPAVAFLGGAGVANHGFELSADGRRLYIASLAPDSCATCTTGLVIFDVSQVQDRVLAPQIRRVGSVSWTDGSIGQHAIPVTWGGKPYLVFVDELGAGAARIIDISDETAPRVVSKLKLQIHMPEYADVRAADTTNTGLFGYEGHYCSVDRRTDPTAVACGYFQSGVRVFDVRNPMRPREIAYFNPPAQTGKNALLPGSEHAQDYVVVGALNDLTADWCSSPPRFVGSQLWVTCQDNGFMTLKFTNGAYPLRASGATRPGPVAGPAAGSESVVRVLAATGGSVPAGILAVALLGTGLVLRRRRRSG